MSYLRRYRNLLILKLLLIWFRVALFVSLDAAYLVDVVLVWLPRGLPSVVLTDCRATRVIDYRNGGLPKHTYLA